MALCNRQQPMKAASRQAGVAMHLRDLFIASILACVASGAAGMGMNDGQPDPQAPVLGAHTLLAQADGRGVSPAVTAPITTQHDGSSLLVLSGGFASNAASPTDTYSNTWTQQGDSVVYDGYEGRFDVKAYVSLSARGGRGHAVSIAKNGNATGEITIPFIEIMHADVLQDVAENYPAPRVADRVSGKVARILRRLTLADPGPTVSLTSGNVTTTGPATLIAVWWGDGFVYDMSAVPGDGFTVIDRFLHLPPDSGVQCAVASRQVSRAGTYHVTWKGSPAQGAILWLFAFQSTADSGN
ncbi:MAG: hypothetical protein OQK79_06810 [Rhodanobacter sp.]|nr:hypothetical protein [Rhodanobacter sp.]